MKLERLVVGQVSFLFSLGLLCRMKEKEGKHEVTCPVIV